MKKYVVKNDETKEYKSLFGETDYNIPVFGFRSALLIFGATLVSLLVCTQLFPFIGMDFRLPNALITGLVCGWSVAYSQFFIERKKGFCRNFWLMAAFFGIAAFFVILVFQL